MIACEVVSAVALNHVSFSFCRLKLHSTEWLEDVGSICNQISVTSVTRTAFRLKFGSESPALFEQGVFIAFCLAQSNKPSMSSTPEMSGMDQVQRWHDQMIYFVPAKQGSYPHPGARPVHPMHSVPGSYVWWPQQPFAELPGVPPAVPTVPAVAAAPAVPPAAPEHGEHGEHGTKEMGGCLQGASCSTLATPRSTEVGQQNRSLLWPPWPVETQGD